MIAASATSPDALTASSRSVVKVAMPQRRGRELPIKAIRNGLEWKLSQCLPFGFFIKLLTGDEAAAASATTGFAFAALGLRISRLLRFCDLAISACPSFIFPGGQRRGSCCPARAGRTFDRIPSGIGSMTIGMCSQHISKHGQLAPVRADFSPVRCCGISHQRYLLIFKNLIETHCAHSHIKRGH